ncbi:hypothetical protein [Dyella sp.]|uniref:lysozyme inhibitor LprI family protein n=1 Tax=Dyella sp. TaxID=1869338 RepID=UPI002ED38024
MKRARYLHGWAALALACAPLAAHAGSIDCEKAASPVEHLVCNDHQLTALDAQMAASYAQAMNRTADQAGLIRSQRTWLKQRNLCQNSPCLAASYDARMQTLAQVPKAGWKTYRDPALGIRFQYLANRQVRPCGEGRERCVKIVGHGMRGDSYFIAFEIQRGTLENVAEKQAGFQRNDEGQWVTSYGPGVPQPVRQFDGPAWKGMDATVTCGVSDEAGYHAGGECYWAVIGDGTHAVVADTPGVGDLDEDAQQSLMSLRFEPSHP